MQTNFDVNSFSVAFMVSANGKMIYPIREKGKVHIPHLVPCKYSPLNPFRPKIVKTPTQHQLNNKESKLGLKWKLVYKPPTPMTQFWPHLKPLFLGLSWTDSFCHSDICPGDICPDQEYLSCHWPDFDQMLNISWGWTGPSSDQTGIELYFDWILLH